MADSACRLSRPMHPSLRTRSPAPAGPSGLSISPNALSALALLSGSTAGASLAHDVIAAGAPTPIFSVTTPAGGARRARRAPGGWAGEGPVLGLAGPAGKQASPWKPQLAAPRARPLAGMTLANCQPDANASTSAALLHRPGAEQAGQHPRRRRRPPGGARHRHRAPRPAGEAAARSTAAWQAAALRPPLPGVHLACLRQPRHWPSRPLHRPLHLPPAVCAAPARRPPCSPPPPPQRTLHGALPPGAVTCGACFRSLRHLEDGRVEASFVLEDGSEHTETCDLLVGADGIRSAVRACLEGEGGGLDGGGWRGQACPCLPHACLLPLLACGWLAPNAPGIGPNLIVMPSLACPAAEQNKWEPQAPVFSGYGYFRGERLVNELKKSQIVILCASVCGSALPSPIRPSACSPLPMAQAWLI